LIADQVIQCDRCDFSFDAMDNRCWISTKESSGPLCPLCATKVFRSVEAWCVWNDCQGIWEDTVHARRAGATEHLSTSHSGIGGRVVPVRIYKEHDDDVPLREWSEARYHEGNE
jgi:hypothetical protein